jgi:hypothetical protein
MRLRHETNIALPLPDLTIRRRGIACNANEKVALLWSIAEGIAGTHLRAYRAQCRTSLLGGALAMQRE